MSEELKIKAQGGGVTGCLYAAAKRSGIGATLVLGHGAGADQWSGFMVSFSEALAERGVDAVTFNFLYTEQKRRVPDSNDVLEACFLSVIDAVRSHKRLGANALFIGGKSMGGRIASQVGSKGLEPLAGLVYLGYPLHPPGRPERSRSAHLSGIRAPMLFVQGSRDAFGTPDELRPIIKESKIDATLYEVEGGDHSLKVPKRIGVPQEDVYRAAQDRILEWISGVLHR
jgi:predicted alpha/beta-hydrolase family hydrolase